jgi:UDP-2,3-diacylglucosamine pyrophosphatase LpxH
MELRRRIKICIFWMFVVSQSSLLAMADQRFEPPLESKGRYLAFISDLHVGLGDIDGKWHPYEDFRWPDALKGLLNEIQLRGRGRVDLVIVGDFLELWQLPDHISCKGNGSDLGCTVEEMVEVAQLVIDGHKEIFTALRSFSQRDDNRIHILPGNHDAAMLLPDVWKLVGDELGAESGRIRLESDGFFVSGDGFIVAEHGNQILGDANRYPSWPEVLDAPTQLVRRPVGEILVQQLFNDIERDYPIIDNLSPEWAGAWYRARDRGFWRSAGDFAHFLILASFEISNSHRINLLGKNEGAPSGDWNIKYARRLGYKLFAYSLPKGDTLRKSLLGTTPESGIEELRKNLTKLIRDENVVPDAQVMDFCDLIAVNSDDHRCRDPKLGQPLKMIPGARAWLMREHLINRREKFPQMTFFVYGHTHGCEVGHAVALKGSDRATVHNTGAFQRLIDRAEYLKKLHQEHPGVSPSEGLSKLTLEDDFEPSYTVVLAPWTSNAYNKPKTWRWLMPEGKKGKLVEPTSAHCRGIE